MYRFKNIWIVLALLFQQNSFAQMIREVPGWLELHPEIESVDSFLSRQSEDFKRQFTLVLETRSSASEDSPPFHPVNPKAPGILLYDTEGSSLLLSGDPSKFQMIDFDPVKKRYQNPKEIAFITNQKTGRIEARVSEPVQCQSCHKQLPRWTGLWIREDSLYGRPVSRKLIPNLRNSIRYADLVWNTGLNLESEEFYPFTGKDEASAPLELRPNLRITRWISRAMGLQVAAEIRPEMKPLALILGTGCFQRLSDFFEERLEKLDSKFYEEFKKLKEKYLKSYPHGILKVETRIDVITKFAFFEAILGPEKISLDSQSSFFDTGWGSDRPVYLPSLYADQIAKDAFEENPKFQEFFVKRVDSLFERVRGYLGEEQASLPPSYHESYEHFIPKNPQSCEAFFLEN